MDVEDWLLVMSKPRMEQDAIWHLNQQGYEAYAPRWEEVKRRAKGWQRVESAMFPRYLFVRPSYAEQDLRPIRSTRGVTQLVRFGSVPATISNGLVSSIKSMEAERLSRSQTLRAFEKGDTITIRSGPFAGVSAQVFSIEAERVVLLMQVINQQQKLVFDQSDLVVG